MRDVSQDRRDDAALRRTSAYLVHHAVFENPSVEPFTDESTEYPVLHPLVEEGIEMFVVQRTEKVLNIEVHDPTTLHLSQRPLNFF